MDSTKFNQNLADFSMRVARGIEKYLQECADACPGCGERTHPEALVFYTDNATDSTPTAAADRWLYSTRLWARCIKCIARGARPPRRSTLWCLTPRPSAGGQCPAPRNEKEEESKLAYPYRLKDHENVVVEQHTAALATLQKQAEGVLGEHATCEDVTCRARRVAHEVIAYAKVNKDRAKEFIHQMAGYNPNGQSTLDPHTKSAW